MSQTLRLALVAAITASVLVGTYHYASQQRPSVVREHNWGSNQRGSGVLNAVSAIGTFDAERRRFSYYTGARARDSGPLTEAPTRVLAQAVHGSVAVRLLASETYEPASADEDALELARVVSAATTQVFPAAAIPVEIDLYFMPEDARFSLAKRVDWHQGRPYALAVFAREGTFPATTPAHELYHVLALGSAQAKPLEAIAKRGAASSYEQVAADLYAACGELLANETLSRETRPNGRVTLPDPSLGERVFEGALGGDELAAVLDILSNESLGAGTFGDLLSVTVFEHLFGDATTVVVDSPEGARLLELCSQTASDPSTLGAWLAELVPATDGEPGR